MTCGSGSTHSPTPDSTDDSALALPGKEPREGTDRKESSQMNPYDSTPTTPTPAAPKRRRWVTPTVAVGTLVAGFAIGAGASGVATAEAPEPEVITETIAEVEAATATVEVTPAVCLDAINSARAGFNVASDLMNVLATALEAAFYQDIAGMEAAIDDLEVLNAELSQNTFATEAAACEGAAR